jgi:hypothetical protein
MGWGMAAETEPMPSLAGGNTEQAVSKLKNRNKFPKPNFEPLPSVISTLLSATCLALVVTWSGLATIGV